MTTKRGIFENLYLSIHRFVFNRRLRRQRRFPQHYVISVGNLSAGGTGKTPVVLYLASRLSGPVLVLLRGYGRRLPPGGLLVADVSGRPLVDQRIAGDEAMLYAAAGVGVAVGPDRAALLDRFGAGHRVVLLDDAMQNPSVARNLEITLLDATVPLERIRIFPAGRFREDLSALSRSDVVLLTRTDLVEAETLERMRKAVSRHVAEERIFNTRHAFSRFDPEPPAGSSFGAFCGIGNPGAFFRMLEREGYGLKCRRDFPDHYDYTRGDLRKLQQEAESEDIHWITTRKDFMRLGDGADVPDGLKNRISVAGIEIRFSGEEEERRFLSHLPEKLRN